MKTYDIPFERIEALNRAIYMLTNENVRLMYCEEDCSWYVNWSCWGATTWEDAKQQGERLLMISALASRLNTGRHYNFVYADDMQTIKDNKKLNFYAEVLSLSIKNGIYDAVVEWIEHGKISC